MNKQIILGVVFAALTGSGLANQLHDKVNAMTESGRRTFTSLLIRQTGAECAAVKRTFFQGLLEKKSAVWNVSCGSKDAYGIVFYDDSANTTRIMTCSALKELGAPACFKKF